MISRDMAALGEYGPAVEDALKELRDERVVERMWEGDHTVWGPDAQALGDRQALLETGRRVDLPGGISRRRRGRRTGADDGASVVKGDRRPYGCSQQELQFFGEREARHG